LIDGVGERHPGCTPVLGGDEGRERRLRGDGTLTVPWTDVAVLFP
jgi:hypothetical protein